MQLIQLLIIIVTHTFPLTTAKTIQLTKNTGNSKTQDIIEKNIANTYSGVAVTHYDCDNPKDLELYETMSVESCAVPIEDVHYNPVVVNVFTRKFMTKIKAYRCKMEYTFLRYHCGMHSHTSVSTETNTLDLIYLMTPEECKSLIPRAGEKQKKYYVDNLEVNNKFYVPFEIGKIILHTDTAGRTLKGNKYDCHGKGMINSYNFRSYMDEIELIYDMQTQKVQDPNGFILPCKFNQGGCKTTYTGKFAYTWETEDHCTLEDLGTILTQMVNWNDRFFIVNEPTNYTVDGFSGTTLQTTKFKNEIFADKKRFCHGEHEVHPTNHDSLFMQIKKGGFDFETQKKNKIDTVEAKNEFILSPSLAKGVDTQAQFFPESGALMQKEINKHGMRSDEIQKYIDFALQHALQLDYIIHSNVQMTRLNHAETIKQLCELERQVKLNTLNLARIDPANAGYILTGNRSKFLETDGALAWLYTCKEMMSPIHGLERCYDKIPVLVAGKTRFIDPVTRRYADPLAVNEITCEAAKDVPFHADITDPESWYTLTPFPHTSQIPSKFKPGTTANMQPWHTYESGTIGIYNNKDVARMLQKIQMGQRQEGLLKQMTAQLRMELTGESEIDGEKFWNEHITRTMYIDNLISPGYFVDMFKLTFGPVTFFIEKLALYYAFYLFLSSAITCISTALRTYQISEFTRNSTQVGKAVIHGLFGILPIKEIFQHLDMTNTSTNGNNSNFHGSDDSFRPPSPPNDNNTSTHKPNPKNKQYEPLHFLTPPPQVMTTVTTTNTDTQAQTHIAQTQLPQRPHDHKCKINLNLTYNIQYKIKRYNINNNLHTHQSHHSNHLTHKYSIP